MLPGLCGDAPAGADCPAAGGSVLPSPTARPRCRAGGGPGYLLQQGPQAQLVRAAALRPLAHVGRRHQPLAGAEVLRVHGPQDRAAGRPGAAPGSSPAAPAPAAAPPQRRRGATCGTRPVPAGEGRGVVLRRRRRRSAGAPPLPFPPLTEADPRQPRRRLPCRGRPPAGRPPAGAGHGRPRPLGGALGRPLLEVQRPHGAAAALARSRRAGRLPFPRGLGVGPPQAARAPAAGGVPP